MSDLVIVAIVSIIPSTIAALMGIKNHDSIKGLELKVNGRLQQLLDAQNAKGRIEERTEQRAIDDKKGE